MTVLRQLSTLYIVGGPSAGTESMALLPAKAGVWFEGEEDTGSLQLPPSLGFCPVLFPFAPYMLLIVHSGKNWVSCHSSWVFWVLPWSSKLVSIVHGVFLPFF